MSDSTPGRARVYVDLSHPESTSRIVLGFEDCDPVPAIGDLLDALDLPGHRAATAECVGISEHGRTASIAVDWASLHELPQ